MATETDVIWANLSSICYRLGSLLSPVLLFSGSVISDTLQPHGLQHTRLPCPSLSPWVCSNSYPLSQWCHPTISSSVIPFSSWPQSFPASWSFPVSWLFPSGGQRIGTLTSASVLPMNIQAWFPLGLTGLVSLLSMGLSRIFSNTTVQSINSLALSLHYGPNLTSILTSITTGKSIDLIMWTFVSKAMPLLLNMLPRFVTAFLPRSRRPLICHRLTT